MIPNDPQQLLSYSRSESSNSATIAMGSSAVDVTREHVGVDPGDIQYQANADVPLSTVAQDILNEYPIEDSFRPDLNYYGSVHSRTQPAQKIHKEDNVEEDEAASSVEDYKPQIEAFAKLQFEDGEFYMNTWSVELGRDLRYAQRWRAQMGTQNAKGQMKRKRKHRSSDSDGGSPMKRKPKQDYSRSHPSSVFSEGGGVIAVDLSDGQPSTGSNGKKATSTSSSSQQLSRKSSSLNKFRPPQTDYQGLAMASLPHGAYDPSNLHVHDYTDCPLIPIHPPNRRTANGEASEEGSVGNHNAISRRHVKIEYNWTKRVFEMIVIGQNGAYLDDEFCCRGEKRDLKEGSNLLIGSVSIKFLLPNCDDDPTIAKILEDYDRWMDPDPAQQKSAIRSEGDEDDCDQSSQTGEDSDSEQASQGRSPEQKTRPKPQGKSKSKADVRVRAGTTGKVVPQIESQDPVPKRKGPGRPPKNGVMSKREMGLLAKKAKEEAKAAAEFKSTSDVPRKDEGGKASDGKLQEGATTQPNAKRKYTKRKNKNNIPQETKDIRESTENTESLAPVQIDPPKATKEKKPARQRSPSPYIDRSTLTEEQLAKPTHNYVVLIHEALTESKDGMLSLPQVYRAIYHKYPYYKFIVPTVGWQSSVRHNLLQHPAFERKKPEGKGWLWGLKEGVTIEKEKKRRPTPPQTQPHYYHPSNNMPHQHGYYPGVPPPQNGLLPYHTHYPSQSPNMQPGMSHAYPTYAPSFYPPQAIPNGIPVPLITATAEKPSIYQSPYATDSQQPDGQQQSQPSGPNSHYSTNPAQSPFTSIEAPKEQSLPNHQELPHSHNGPSPLQLSPNMSPEERQAVERFAEVLLSEIPDRAYGELVLASAINRVFGSQQSSSLEGRGPGMPEDPREITVMDALKRVVRNQSSREAQVEQSSEAGRLTPGTIARGLVGEEGSSQEVVTADTKVEPDALAAVTVGAAPEVKSTKLGSELHLVARPRPPQDASQDQVLSRAPEETLTVNNHDGAQSATATVTVN